MRGNSEHSKRADCVCCGLRGLDFSDMGWMSQGIRPSTLAASDVQLRVELRPRQAGTG